MQVSDYARVLLKIMIWREMRGVPEAWGAVAWVVRNRVNHSSWWGRTIVEVVTHPWQFSSMTAHGDPNLTQWPKEDSTWEGIGKAVDEVLFPGATWDGKNCVTVAANPSPDPTNGATLYFTKPLTEPPIAWGQVVKTAEIGRVQFYRHA